MEVKLLKIIANRFTLEAVFLIFPMVEIYNKAEEVGLGYIILLD